MHGGGELVRDENVAEMEEVKGAANWNFDLRHGIVAEAGTTVRKTLVSEKRAQSNARNEAAPAAKRATQAGAN
jgi:hypothetical protein